MICNRCLVESKLIDKCAGCSSIMDGFNEPVIKNCSDQRRKDSERFKSVSNCFLMDVITNITFNQIINSSLPEKELIDYLIDFLLPSKRAIDDSSVFNLSLNPSIKSTLFQIILRYEPENVEDHLMSIFSRSKQFLMNNYDPSDLINLKLMYINSIEDNLCSRSDNRVQMAIDYLKNEFSMINISRCGAEDITQFKLIANIKFCISILADIVIDFDSSDKSHCELASSVEELIEQLEDSAQERCPWIRFYLIKLIFRRHGKSDSVKIATNQQLAWIFPTNLISKDIPDNFLALGPLYKNTRDLISDSLTTDQEMDLKNVS